MILITTYWTYYLAPIFSVVKLYLHSVLVKILMASSSITKIVTVQMPA